MHRLFKCSYSFFREEKHEFFRIICLKLKKLFEHSISFTFMVECCTKKFLVVAEVIKFIRNYTLSDHMFFLGIPILIKNCIFNI